MHKPIPDIELLNLYNHYKASLNYDGYVAEYARENNLHVKGFAQFHLRMNPWTGSYKSKKDEELNYTELYQSQGGSARIFCQKYPISPSRLTLVSSYLNLMKRLNVLLNTAQSKTQETEMNFIEVPKKQEKAWDKYEQVLDKEEEDRIAANDRQELMHSMENKSSITPHEVIKAQNDIELIITKGVRVFISPQIESDKIIKIIELLKDL